MRRRLALPLGLALGLTACLGAIRYHQRPHPENREAEATHLSTGECDGVPLIDPAALFTGPWQLSPDRPPAGTVVALDGLPKAQMICTLLGCDAECCDNACGHSPGCTYVLSAGEENELCLGHDDFACGGTDCSGWCRPFSTHPKHRYRFVGELSYVGVEEPRTSLPGARLDVHRFCRLD